MISEQSHPLLTELTGVGAFSTYAGFNVCTYAGATGIETDLRRLEQWTGLDRSRMVFPIQTHSANVDIVSNGSGDLRGVDGVVTAEPDLLIGVHTADCLPLLLADEVNGVVGAVHCGWRGSVSGIVDRAVEAMVTAGANTDHVRAAMGPCICARCFEVGEEVADLFPAEAVIRRPGTKPHVDLARAAELRLKAAGVTYIQPSAACSKESERLYSVRRQGRTLPYRTLTAIRLFRKK